MSEVKFFPILNWFNIVFISVVILLVTVYVFKRNGVISKVRQIYNF